MRAALDAAGLDAVPITVLCFGKGRHLDDFSV